MSDLAPVRSRQPLRQLLRTCHRDLAYYGYCLPRIRDAELVAAIEQVRQVRQHLVRALTPLISDTSALRPADQLGALLGWEAALRARLSRLGDIAFAVEIERLESELLEQVEDATLTPRLAAGVRIALERHLALIRHASDCAAAAANRLRSRPRPAVAVRHSTRPAPAPQPELDVSMTRAM
jgi:hypothetical protein